MTTEPPPSIASSPNTASPPNGWLKFLLRMWLLQPARAAPAGSALPACLAMTLLWLAMWVGIDYWQSQPDPHFSADGIPLLAWYALAVLLLAAVLRSRSTQPPFATALALALGAVPLPLLLTGVLSSYLEPVGFDAVTVLVALYLAVYFSRALRAVSGSSPRVGALLAVVYLTGFAWASDALNAIPDVWAPAAAQSAQAQDAVDGEALLFEQAARIDQALGAIARAAPTAAPRAFFLGFAGVGDQKVFAQEIGLASRVLGERYRIDGRTLSLLNDERDLEHAPLATVTGLKYALRGLAERMNLDRDILFLSISSHGSQDPAIAVSNSGLPLDDLTDEDLADALSDSGIKWKVIVISACYAGGFLDSLRDPQTIVIAAAAADRTSFGCSNDRDLTYFGEAFYRDALPGARSLRAAFDGAKSAIGERERREHVDASNPQAYFGAKLEARLAGMEPAP